MMPTKPKTRSPMVMPTNNACFLTQPEAAAFLRLSERTLERFRLTGDGPSFRAFGRRRIYARADLLAWADARKRTSTSASTAA